jgi:two-component system LytT family response regulator
MKIRTILVDDQSTALTTLRDMLHSCGPDVEVIGTAVGGAQGVEMINRLAPDLIFLDVQMPEMDGFQTLAQIKLPQMPIVIFVTGHDGFALQAFEAHALDYLLKPCRMTRLRSAVQRARQLLENRQSGQIEMKLDGLLSDLKRGVKYPERLAVKSNGRIVFLRLTDIDLAEASDNYVKLYAGGDSYMFRETLTALEEKLSPERFLRISRSIIVNIESVKELQPMFHGEYVVLLRNGTKVTLTRGYRKQLQQLGVTL